MPQTGPGLYAVGIGALTNLRELRVSGNKLSSLSAEVGSLRKLHRFIADNNLLTSIPGSSQLLNPATAPVSVGTARSPVLQMSSGHAVMAWHSRQQGALQSQDTLCGRRGWLRFWFVFSWAEHEGSNTYCLLRPLLISFFKHSTLFRPHLLCLPVLTMRVLALDGRTSCLNLLQQICDHSTYAPQ